MIERALNSAGESDSERCAHLSAHEVLEAAEIEWSCVAERQKHQIRDVLMARALRADVLWRLERALERGRVQFVSSHYVGRWLARTLRFALSEERRCVAGGGGVMSELLELEVWPEGMANLEGGDDEEQRLDALRNLFRELPQDKLKVVAATIDRKQPMNGAERVRLHRARSRLQAHLRRHGVQSVRRVNPEGRRPPR